MFLFLVGLACLLPLAMYCLYMAMLHQRAQPTMLPGAWDMVGVLAALSGFLVVGGTVLVFSIHSAARDFWLMHGTLHDLRRVHSEAGALAFGIWGMYFALLVGGSAYLIWLRRGCSIIYHLTPSEVETLLPGVMDRLSLPYLRRGARWLVGNVEKPLTTFEKAMTGGPRDSGTKAVAEVDGSHAMRQVTLRWSHATGTVRSDVEAELARDLAAFPSPPSPAPTWFLTAAGSLFTIMIFLLGTFVLVAFRS